MKIYDVFISYRRSDGAAIAAALAAHLREKGLRVFFDQNEIKDSEDFTKRIEGSLRQSSNYLLVATTDAFKFRKDEDWVQREMEIACEKFDSVHGVHRTITVVAPRDAQIPLPAELPENIRDIAKPNRIFLSGNVPTDGELRRVLKAVTAINRRNLWNAAHRWYELACQPGSRFASLNINERILPLASEVKKKRQLPILVRQELESRKGDTRKSVPLPLFDALKTARGHVYLIGQGGIGKTTALMHIMSRSYAENEYTHNTQIPIFVELSRAPDTYGALYEGGVSTFIRRAIYKHVRADKKVKQISKGEVGGLEEAFTLPPEAAVEPVDDLLTMQSPAPEYLLLLDGLNEVSRTVIEETGKPVISMLIKEIQWMLQNCPNVRIVLTSRTDETMIRDQRIARLHLSGVGVDTIAAYLREHGFEEAAICRIQNSRQLAQVLQIPLFLTMFAQLRQFGEVASRGEILRAFFHERSENLTEYSQQNRIDMIDADVSTAASAVQPKRLNAKMQMFILDFILPEIAWAMERRGIFRMDIEDTVGLTDGLLCGKELHQFCGKYGKKVFTKYRGDSIKEHVAAVAKSMLVHLGEDEEELAETVIDCAIMGLGILQQENGKIGFVHHHIRDFFAAKKYVNLLRIAVYAWEEEDADTARKALALMQPSPLSFEVCRFIGEYLGETRNAPGMDEGVWHYNVPAQPCDRNIIKRALDIYRCRFDGQDGYCVSNLIEVLKNTRGNLSGADLTNLDLTRCSFNEVDLGQRGGGADFTGSKLHGENLLPLGHSRYIRYMEIHTKEKWLLTYATNGIKIWNTDTWELIRTLDAARAENFSAVVFFGGTRQVLIGANRTSGGVTTGQIRLWDVDTGAVTTVYDSFEKINSICCSPDAEQFVAFYARDNIAEIWSAREQKHICRLTGHRNGINSVVYQPKGDLIFTASRDGTVIAWNRNTGALVRQYTGHTDDVEMVDCDPTGKYIITACRDRYVRKWDVQTGTQIYSFVSNQENYTVYAARFSHNGKFIMTQDIYLRLWDAETGEYINSVILDRPTGRDICATTLDDRFVLFQASNEHIYVCSVTTGERAHTIRSAISGFEHCQFNAADRELILIPETGTANIYDVDTGILKRVMEGHAEMVRTVALSPDRRYLASGGFDYYVRIWEYHTGRLLHTLATMNEAYSLDFSASGRYLLVAYRGKAPAVVWEAATGKQVCQVGSNYRFAAFLPDEKHIITFGRYTPAEKWNIETGECELQISHAPGLQAINARMEHLHPDSRFTPEQKEILRQNGAQLLPDE